MQDNNQQFIGEDSPHYHKSLCVNIGEDARFYIEVFNPDMPEEELKYGDMKMIDGTIAVWFGSSEDEFGDSGWVVNDNNRSGYNAAVYNIVFGNYLESNGSLIVRILNNDLNFDEQAYLERKGSIAENNDV